MTGCLTDFLKKQDVKYIESFDISTVSSIGIGGQAAFAVIPDGLDKLIKTVDFCVDNFIKYIVVGKMTNILPPDDTFDGVMIITTKISNYCVAEKALNAQCGTVFSKMIYEAASLSLGGAESLYGIPGTVGGMVSGNAGAYGTEISDILSECRVYDPYEKKIIRLTHNDMKFSYRDSFIKNSHLILLDARFEFENKDAEIIIKSLKEIMLRRKASQPYGEKSLGSIFKRKDGIPLSLLIDKLGLKGMRVGGAEISQKHAGFIINKNCASSSDVKELIKIVKDKLFSSYGITAEEEIQYMQ